MADYESATSFLGEWGPFQRRVFLLLCLIVVPNGLSPFAVVFFADTPPHSCVIPARLNLTAAWRNSSIPLVAAQDGRLVPSQCSRYRVGDLQEFSQRGLVPWVDVNLTQLPREGCLDGWEYDRSVYVATIVSEWDLVCDDGWKKPMTSSLFFSGILVGSFCSGQLSDRYGRKKVLFVAKGMQTLLMFIQTFSSSWTMFCALHFLVGIVQISNYISAFVLGTEILGPQMRFLFSTAGANIFFALGYMLLPLMAFYTRDWRNLLLCISLPTLVYIPFWWLIPESPRWLVSQGKVEMAEAIIKNAARKNKLESPQTIFTACEKEVQSAPRKNHNMCDLLRSRNMRWLSVTLWLVWINMNIGYFALSLNTSNLAGDMYFNCFLSALVEVPAYILSWVLFRWCPRRLTLCPTFFLGGLCLFVIQLIPANLHAVGITLEMMGKFCLTVVFSIIYAYTTELYPTVLRNSALGACSMAARIGAIVAPYFIFLRSYSVSLPYILMASLSVLSGVLSLLLPESFGIPLPDDPDDVQPFPGCCRKNYSHARTTEEETIPGKQVPESLSKLQENNSDGLAEAVSFSPFK
ncbi:organic cation/carnitine transporter 2-like isoform X1 [Synchiropus splendidus]|uniref:organic cation/carnitine transporter 2-like isoform X1 n=1 Tax=Synchiropus splendidus TaxID=270530 RepID=UPI00237E683E|nr:organic cation/carnitine transporter 2-like isoform X1 [Synchiropus splendidus]